MLRGTINLVVASQRREYPSEVVGYTSDDPPSVTTPTKILDFVHQANLPPEEGISLGERNIPWQVDGPEPRFSERFMHHLPPLGPLPVHRQAQEMFGRVDFLDSNIPNRGKSTMTYQTLTEEYVSIRRLGFKQDQKWQAAGLDNNYNSSTRRQ